MFTSGGLERMYSFFLSEKRAIFKFLIYFILVCLIPASLAGDINIFWLFVSLY